MADKSGLGVGRKTPVDEAVPPLAKDLGTQVRAARRAKGLTQEALAYAAGISRQYVQLIEKGRANLTLAILVALSAALEISFVISHST